MLTSTPPRVSFNFSRTFSVLGFMIPDIFMRLVFPSFRFTSYLHIKGLFYAFVVPINEYYITELIPRSGYRPSLTRVLQISFNAFLLWFFIIVPLVGLAVVLNLGFSETIVSSPLGFIMAFSINGFGHFLLHILNDWTFPYFSTFFILISLFIQKMVTVGILSLSNLSFSFNPEHVFFFFWTLSTIVYVLLKILFIYAYVRINNINLTESSEVEIPRESMREFALRALPTMAILLISSTDQWITFLISSDSFNITLRECIERTKLSDCFFNTSLQLISIFGVFWVQATCVQVLRVSLIILTISCFGSSFLFFITQDISQINYSSLFCYILYPISRLTAVWTLKIIYLRNQGRLPLYIAVIIFIISRIVLCLIQDTFIALIIYISSFAVIPLTLVFNARNRAATPEILN